jgi:hypothetical protein
MDLYHNIMFYDQEIILLKDTYYVHMFYFFVHQFQRMILYHYDKFHYQVDELMYISSINIIQKEELVSVTPYGAKMWNSRNRSKKSLVTRFLCPLAIETYLNLKFTLFILLCKIYEFHKRKYLTYSMSFKCVKIFAIF